MSRSTLKRIRRLAADAAPVIEKRDRWHSELEKWLPRLAEEHLLRVILVFQYGKPRIDEPLALAHERALSKLGVGEESSLDRIRGILKRKPPAGDIKFKISTWVRQVPDWLRYFCRTNLSMALLGLANTPVPKELLKFARAKSDKETWPLLPEDKLIPRPYYDEQQYRFVTKMSMQQARAYIEIRQKPEQEWTRHEHKFVKAVHTRMDRKRSAG